MIQILQLLDERRLCLSLSINRKELLFLSGLGLLWQNVSLKRDSKIAQESQKLLTTVVDLLKVESTPAAAEFSVVANILISRDSGKRGLAAKSGQTQEMLAPSQRFTKSPSMRLQPWNFNMPTDTDSGEPIKHEPPTRRATVSGGTPPYTQRLLKSPNRASHGLSQPGNFSTPDLTTDRSQSVDNSTDYHSEPAVSSYPGLSELGPAAITPADWEFVLSDMDRGYSNIFTGIYGGKECGEDPGPFASLTAEYGQKPIEVPLSLQPQHGNELQGLSPESSGDIPAKPGQTAQSVLSYSEESMGSVEDGAAPFGDILDPFKGIMIPATEDDMDGFGLVDCWERRLAV